MKHFCEELKSAREFKKVALKEISATTKINIDFLQALEDGRWDILPEPYIKGFLKSYAQCVGMNVLKVLKKYDELEKGIAPLDEKVPEDQQKLAPPEPPPPPPRSRFPAVKVRTHGLLYGLIVVVIVVVGVILLSRRESKPLEEATSVSEPEVSAVSSDTVAAEQVSESLPPSVEAEVLETFTVEALFLEPCYLEIALDDSITRDFMFQAGQSMTWKPIRSLRMKLGNAGGTRVSHNGNDLGILGVSNQVVTLTLEPSGIVEKIMGPAPLQAQEVDTF